MTTTTSPRGIHCTETILVPQNESLFLNSVKAAANPRQIQSTIFDVEKAVISIQHKLNVAMYQAALICELNADHFTLFQNNENLNTTDHTDVLYKICLFCIDNIDEYKLVLTLFIETFAAMIFSLFDVSGSLINILYDLQLAEKEVSLQKVIEVINKTTGSIKPSDVVAKLLYSYSSYSEIDAKYTSKALREIKWVKSMREIRNRTTHRSIFDVCDAQLIRREDIFARANSGQSRQTTVFLLNQDLWPDKKLCEFVEEVFNDLEQFVEDFYYDLVQAVQNSGSLPIY